VIAGHTAATAGYRSADLGRERAVQPAATPLAGVCNCCCGDGRPGYVGVLFTVSPVEP
jgi:hypothetical protein